MPVDQKKNGAQIARPGCEKKQFIPPTRGCQRLVAWSMARRRTPRYLAIESVFFPTVGAAETDLTTAR
jgi:hypothetical protein